MRKPAVLAAIAVLLFGAGVAVAQSPSPSPSSSSSSGATTPSTTSTTSSTTSWSADLKPQTGVTGSVHFRENSDGTGTVTLRLLGLARSAPWVVEIDGGSLTNPGIGDRIAVKSGSSVRETGIDELTIDLTKTEMRDFLHDLSSDGVVVAVSDGTHESVATLPPS
jgi:hypothetical protein